MSARTSGRSKWAAELLDEALDDEVLVIGSAPPYGNDLDLLVRPAQEPALEEALTDAGFACQPIPPFRGYPRGFRIWARFRGCDAHAVDDIPVGNLELPPEECERLFSDARPIPGFARLLRPSPPHVLLILAHNFLDPKDGSTPLAAGRRRRIGIALDEEPAAWDLAGELAPSWDSAERLQRLRSAFELGEAAGRAVAGEAPEPLSRVQALRQYRRAWRSGRLIAFSGPDDATRSEQAEGLRRALEGLDIPVRLVRTALPRSGALGVARQLRHAVLPGLRAGEVVICDRYVLDAAVSLRLRHGKRPWVSRYTTLLRLLVPPARRAYLVDSPGPRGEVFREQSGVQSIRQVDGTRAPEDLCAEIALDVWQAVR